MPNQKNIAVIGGGAAGIFAAVNYAEKNPQSKVSVFESGSKALSKVLISGGGRCNVTNYTPDINELILRYPRGGRELRGAFNRFGVLDTMEWFTHRGVILKTEDDKRVFPKNDRSSTIADCLLHSARDLGIEIRLKEKVSHIEKSEQSEDFKLFLKDTTEVFNCVILASGGNEKSFELARSLGHTIVSPVPSLFTFEIEDPILRELSGVSFSNVEASININNKSFSNRGPLLITHWGLSGPAVIVLSSLAARELFSANYHSKLHINFIPHLNHEKSIQLIEMHKERNLNSDPKKSNPFLLPTSFWINVLKKIIPEPKTTYQSLSKKSLHAIVEYLRKSPFEIKGKGKFKEEFVTAGGISLKEVNFKTMESKVCKNLYLAGEVLNIDGVTGGFNFQSAWTTSWLASQNIP